MKLAKNLLIALSILVLFASCSKSSDVGSPEKAKEILEKSFQKFSELTMKDSKGIKSVAAKALIKGSGQMPMGQSGNMPISIDATVEIYAVKPSNFYLDISGNLGNARVVVIEKESKAIATIILPGTKQFATMDVPQKIIQQTQQTDPKQPNKMDDFWKQADLEYGGKENTKSGKAHKIIIKSKNPEDKNIINAYILDGKWDPQRFEITSADGGMFVVEFEKLDLNVNVPDKTFVPDTQGYTQVASQQITSAIMMQLITSMMQQQNAQK